MRIIPSTKKGYAYIEWEKGDEIEISQLPGALLDAAVEAKLPKGMRIEVADTDLLPEHARNSLHEGRFLIIA